MKENLVEAEQSKVEEVIENNSILDENKIARETSDMEDNIVEADNYNTVDEKTYIDEVFRKYHTI